MYTCTMHACMYVDDYTQGFNFVLHGTLAYTALALSMVSAVYVLDHLIVVCYLVEIVITFKRVPSHTCTFMHACIHA